MDTKTGNDLFFGNCTKCTTPVYGVGKACQAMGDLYHDTCFICSTCGKGLRGSTFYNVSGNIFCEDDFLCSKFSGVHPTAEVCDACGHLIMDKFIQALGKSYHLACFCCVVCKVNLEGTSFTVDKDNNIYCVNDYYRVWAPRCAACGKSILPSEGSTESIRIVSSFNKNYHVKCND